MGKLQKLGEDTELKKLHESLFGLISKELSPVAERYAYSKAALEDKVKWKPVVLLLGNYSSGKSSLINELVGAKVQETGQAPTDDSFTVITGEASQRKDLSEGSIIGERDGKVLLSDDKYPFSSLKKHGESFAAHFKLKTINSPWLERLAIIDTPGMLDSVSENDRAYDYQAVVGDLAQLADLILVFFDPHKAGTIKESYTSLRETLPNKSFEDRIVFVMNRIDECQNLDDLLRVYGTLCWNLSQMTGRKDIPRILLTYAPSASTMGAGKEAQGVLPLLDNQRDELRAHILRAPYRRLDHLVHFVDFHCERLEHLLEALEAYQRKKTVFALKASILGFTAALFLGLFLTSYLHLMNNFGELSFKQSIFWGSFSAVLSYIGWQLVLFKFIFPGFLARLLTKTNEFTKLDDQSRQDSWNYIADLLKNLLKAGDIKLRTSVIKKDREKLKNLHSQGLPRLRSALNEHLQKSF